MSPPLAPCSLTPHSWCRGWHAHIRHVIRGKRESAAGDTEAAMERCYGPLAPHCWSTVTPTRRPSCTPDSSSLWRLSAASQRMSSSTGRYHSGSSHQGVTNSAEFPSQNSILFLDTETSNFTHFHVFTLSCVSFISFLILFLLYLPSFNSSALL